MMVLAEVTSADSVRKAFVRPNGTFVAVGFDSLIRTSPDGVSWQTRVPPGSGHLRSVAFGNGVFVAVGDTGRFTGGESPIFVSADGDVWTRMDCLTANGLEGVAYSQGAFYAVGLYGTVLETIFENYIRLEVARLSLKGECLLNIHAPAFRSCSILYSTDLGQWSSLARITNATRSFLFVDEWANPNPRRFYRVTGTDRN